MSHGRAKTHLLFPYHMYQPKSSVSESSPTSGPPRIRFIPRACPVKSLCKGDTFQRYVLQYHLFGLDNRSLDAPEDHLLATNAACQEQSFCAERVQALCDSVSDDERLCTTRLEPASFELCETYISTRNPSLSLDICFIYWPVFSSCEAAPAPPTLCPVVTRWNCCVASKCSLIQLDFEKEFLPIWTQRSELPDHY